MKVNLTAYSPSFAQSSVQNQDVDELLEKAITEPCGTDALSFSEKSGNSSAKSLSHAGKTIASSLKREVDNRNKLEAFAKRFPKDAELIPYDTEVAERYKAFTDYTRTSEEVEICNLLNSERTIPVDIRDKVAKQVAAIIGFNGYLSNDIAEKMTLFALNYWIAKNPVLRERIELSVDRN